MIDKLLQNKVVKNASWIVGGAVLQKLINFLVTLLTARYLGPSNYGLINYATAYTGFFYSICTLGIDSILVKELIDIPNEEGKVLGTSLFLRSLSSIFSAFAILCIVHVVDDGDPTTMTVVALTNIGMIFQLFHVFKFWFQSRLQSRVPAIVTLLAYIVMAVYKIILLVLGKSVVWFAFASAVEYICIGILLMIAYWKYGGRRLRVSRKHCQSILQKSRHFILPGLMIAVYAQTDKIMLKQMIGEAEVGFYATAVSLCTAWCFVLSAIIDSLYPEIAKVHKTDNRLFARRNKQLYAIVFYLSVAVSLLITCFAKPAIYIMYGEAYMPTAAPLRVITWYTAFSYLGVARNAWIVCEDRQKYIFGVYVSAAVSNVILNLILIPRWGAVGAAAASLAAQIITIMVAPFFIKGLQENAKLMVEAILLKDVLPHR